MRVSLVTLGDPKTLTGGYLYHLRMAELAPDQGAEVTFFSFPDLPFPMPIASGRRMVAATRRSDVVVVDSIAAWCAVPWLRAVKAPVVGMLHQRPGGMDHGAGRRKLQAFLDRRSYRHMDRVLVASAALAHDLTRVIETERVAVVAPGRDVAEPEPRSFDLRGDHKVAFLSVGNWVPRKGTVELLQAFRRTPDVGVLHLVGRTDVDPGYARRVKHLLAADDLRDRIVVHGPVPKERVATMYLAADAFVLPSIEEPYGTVYGEAMASGLPVIGWDAGNLPHLAGADAALVVPTGDVQALTAALTKIANDDELRGALSTAAKARAESFPTWHDTAVLFFSELRQVVTASKNDTA